MSGHGPRDVPHGLFGDGCVHTRVDLPLERQDLGPSSGVLEAAAKLDVRLIPSQDEGADAVANRSGAPRSFPGPCTTAPTWVDRVGVALPPREPSSQSGSGCTPCRSLPCT
jgi:hypothetical protein